ncbi:MAG: alanine--tRNA ligase [Candidatus Omnitrophica bacterium]|nr:alanine--tRNA ligase [Candidatus Omnitrophota bacterium]
MMISKIRQSGQIRQDFLDFFKSKQHTIVPSSSLLPDSPNLLFTNAGMNQFVPIFLGQVPPDVSRWPGAIPGKPNRAADTQKCIRAGGKHNDLEDVGLDTYHHTFFEMLGNWSFGDYFKQQAIEWAWELVTEIWQFPRNRLYATVYKPGPGDPSGFDQEAYDYWARLFSAAGLDPAVHIQFGGKKDNFWMMGETGPCGPCSELHVDLTPAGDTRGRWVNAGSPQCIELWNLVFMQFNANPDGSFSPLPARNVDTGMGFERVTSIIQCTRHFTDFNRVISNYETDIFRPFFDQLEKMSGKKYASTLPAAHAPVPSPQVAIDVAFRVIADHIRTLGFAIADGILPGHTDRNYVLRRILRRAVRYGRTLGFHEPFFYRLADVLAETMGDVFPEIRARQPQVQEVVRLEEEAFNKTLDRGIELFTDEVERNLGTGRAAAGSESREERAARISGEFAFKLYDTYGFPLDLTELMARERGLAVDTAGFETLMEAQRARARAAQKREIIELSQVETAAPTRFIGYDQLSTPAKVIEVLKLKEKTAVILDTSVCYAEMGGQVGDTGQLSYGGQLYRIVDTQHAGDAWLHFLAEEPPDLEPGAELTLSVDKSRREAIQRHHTVTHLLHWALHQVVSREVSQKGSFVGPEKLTFDFNSAPLAPAQVAVVEKLVNERILENAAVSWTEVPYPEIRGRSDVMQFFGEKYGERVRVVQIGGQAGELNGYSMELCGGTHSRATGEIGLFRIMSESAIAAGMRRIEAVAGLRAYEKTRQETELIGALAARVNAPPAELEKKLENLLAQQKELEKQIKAARQRQAGELARDLAARAEMVASTPVILKNLGEVEAEFLHTVADNLKGQFEGVVVLGGATNGSVSLIATVAPELTRRVQAGKLIQAIAPIVGGKGGGKPDFARGGGKNPGKLDEALTKVKTLL